ncbi:prolyl 4-hydroxylase subunit alpha-1-like [Lineus longissimus]|uniref:prolyl 4-hydroxylase subunit alpha-1-like n=1 Tax=Lineus longissimus TaxID=88925 RepID=UPI002B4C6843
MSPMKSCRLLTLILFILAEYASCEIYTAVFRIQEALKEEATLLKEARDVINCMEHMGREDTAIDKLRRFVDATAAARRNTSRQWDHPLAGYHLVHRMLGWYEVAAGLDDIIDNERVDRFLEMIPWKHPNRSKSFPGPSDRTGVATAIINLRQYYGISFEDWAAGRVAGIRVEPLTVDEFYHVGETASHISRYEQAVDWLEETVRRLENKAPAKRMNLRRAKRQLARTYRYNSQFEKAMNLSRGLHLHDPMSTVLEDEYHNYQRLFKEANETVTPPRLNLMETIRKTEIQLCRGNEKYAKSDKELVCFEKEVDFFERFKLEEISKDPELYVIHDTLTNKQVDDAVNNNVLRKSISRMGTYGSQTTDIRIVQGTSLTMHMTEFAYGLEDTIGRVTGLDAIGKTRAKNRWPSDDLLLVNYGIGGLYNTHHDSMETGRPQFKETGRRIATWITYLSNVTKGGGTIFPELNIKVDAKKGASLFWYNHYRNGTLDERLEHSGCPVLMGSKWIVTKWIREHENMFRRPCSLNKLE